MKKYFFFDIDGTLAYGLTKQIPESTFHCINMLQKKGHFVSIATGRLQKDAFSFSQKIGVSSLVADGGNSVTLGGKILQMQSLPVEECISLLNDLDTLKKPWAVTTQNETIRYTRNDSFEKTVTDTYYETKIIPTFEQSEQSSFYKVFISCPIEKENEINFRTLPTVRYSKECVFIEPKSKSVGIKKILDIIDVQESDVVVFGNGTNDIEMFRPEWFSIAMGNSCTALKKKANYITQNCDQDGIYYACTKFGWI